MNEHRWTADALRSAEIGVLIGCLALAIYGSVHRVAPNWEGTYLALFCGLAAAEGAYSFHAYRRDSPLSLRGIWLRIVELGSLLVLRQIGEEMVGGREVLQGSVPRFDGGAMLQSAFAGLVLLIAWLLGTHVARTMSRLGEVPLGDPAYVSPQRRLVTQFFAGGVVIFCAAAMAQGKVHLTSPLEYRPDVAIMAGVLVYFLIGLLLLGQVQYLYLSRLWEQRQSTVADRVGIAWARQALGVTGVVIAGGALLALIEPGTLADLAGKGWLAAVSAMSLILSVLLGVFARLIFLIHNLGFHSPFADHASSSTPTVDVPTPSVTWQDDRPAVTVQGQHDFDPLLLAAPLVPVIRWVLLWSVVVASVGYRVRVLRRRAPLAPAAPSLWQALCSGQILALFRWFWFGVWPQSRVHAERSVSAAAVSGAQSEDRLAVPATRRFRRYRAQSPRDRVVRSYLNVVQRAQGSGIERHGSQTAQEFSAAVIAGVPAAGEDLAALTETFMNARYGEYAPFENEAEEARRRERAVARALRHVRRPEETVAED